jgi:uncharacterized protein YgfB (UPF0149 family)
MADWNMTPINVSPRAQVVVISRLVGQKQIDILAQDLREIRNGRKLPFDIEVVVLGTGDNAIEEEFIRLAKEGIANIPLVYVQWPSYKLASWLYAGADMILVPSDFEPSGLTQLIGMRYGCVPIVRLTGGLADTVAENWGNVGVWTGFSFPGVSRTFDDLPKDYFVWLQQAIMGELGSRNGNINAVVEHFSNIFEFSDNSLKKFHYYVSKIETMRQQAAQHYYDIHNRLKYTITKSLRVVHSAAQLEGFMSGLFGGMNLNHHEQDAAKQYIAVVWELMQETNGLYGAMQQNVYEQVVNALRAAQGQAGADPYFDPARYVNPTINHFASEFGLTSEAYEGLARYVWSIMHKLQNADQLTAQLPGRSVFITIIKTYGTLLLKTECVSLTAGKKEWEIISTFTDG